MSLIPYPGLRPFTSEESDIFFGREDHTKQLLEKLSRHRFISVIGPSGCGKSSLTRAGLIAALDTFSKAGTSWRVAKMRPGGEHPLRNLAEALLLNTVLNHEHTESFGEQTQVDPKILPFLVSSLRRGPMGLVEIVREAQLPKLTNVLLLVDQFEEIFRYHQDGGRDETEAFVALLLASAKQKEIPIYVIITMRSDFIGKCAVFHDLPEMLNMNQFLIPHLTRDQQRMAIIGPVGMFGGSVEPHLVNHLLNETGTEPDQLPLLQHCLMRMWFHAKVRMGILEETIKPPLSAVTTSDGVKVTLEDYEAVGGLQDALSKHADEAFESLNEQQQRIAERLFRCLSERSAERRDTRRPMPVNEIATVAAVSESEVIAVADQFRHPERCFMTPAADVPLEPETILDISHESLIRQWQRMDAWAEEEAKSAVIYRRLEQTAYLWKEKKAGLWGTPDLEIALDWREREKPTVGWAKRYGNHFNATMEFLDASEKTQEENRQKNLRQIRRQFQQKLVLVLVGLVIAVGFAVWALREKSNAENARAIAENSSSGFQKMVKATFGFLKESKQNKVFLDWVRKTSTIEELIPVLHLMIDSSEMDKDQKKYWHDKLAVMSNKDRAELLDILGTEFVEKTRTK